MAGYGYTSMGSYTTTTTHNGAPPRTDGRSKTSYTSDQESQPVFVAAADRRRKPVTSYTLTRDAESYFITTEIVVELPCVYQYRRSSPEKVVVMACDGNEGKWVRPSSPACYHGAEKWINRYSNRS